MTRGKKQVAFQKYLLYDQLIPEASTYKYLGVHINSHLNWNDHVNAVVAKAKRMLGRGLDGARPEGSASSSGESGLVLDLKSR